MKRKRVRCAPLIQSAIDKLGWKSSFYSIREGYNNLLLNSEVPLKSIICNNIQRVDAIPQVDTFCWLLRHKRNLASENIRKCGIVGHSRCPLCEKLDESIPCLFLSFPYIMAVWDTTLIPLSLEPSGLRISKKKKISLWHKSFMGSLQTKSSFEVIWNALPKYLCQRVYLFRNSSIFKSIFISARALMLKFLSFYLEYNPPTTDFATLLLFLV